MSLDTQTKQTLASMSWARLTWRQRIERSNIVSYTSEFLASIPSREETTYFLLKMPVERITTKTLSQMEVVSCCQEQSLK